MKGNNVITVDGENDVLNNANPINVNTYESSESQHEAANNA